MSSTITNPATEACLRRVLLKEGFQLSPERRKGETGVDIIASSAEATYHIEVIGHKSSGPARAKDFYESFFRAISRLKDDAKICVIALPHLAKRGLPTRAKHYGIGWERIGNAFPELQIWLVNVEENTYERHTWNEWFS